MHPLSNVTINAAELAYLEARFKLVSCTAEWGFKVEFRSANDLRLATLILASLRGRSLSAGRAPAHALESGQRVSPDTGPLIA